MPYLLQSNQNRVENIKKKFENSYFDAKGDNPSRNYKSINSPPKTKPALDSKAGNLENECDISDKHKLKSDKHSVKSEVNKGDGKAVVRRSPAFRREKQNYGKTVPKLSNINESPSQEGRDFPREKAELNSSLNDMPNTVKLNNSNLPKSSTEPIQFLHFHSTTSNNNNRDNASSSFIPKSNQVKQEKDKSSQNACSDKVSMQYSNINKSTSGRSGSETKNELKLTDSLRLALKAPLPKGPPPKKPPRTFVHTIQANNTLTDGQEQSATISAKDPLLRLKLDKIEKVVKNLETRTQSNMPWEGNKVDARRPSPKLSDANEINSGQTQNTFPKLPADTFSLKSLNCISTDSYERGSTFEKEPERASSFYVDNPKDGKDCNKTDLKNSHLGGLAPVFDIVPKRSGTEPIYDLPCITKKSSFESFGKGLRKVGSTAPQQLHYMCTDVVNTHKQGAPPIFSSLNQPDSNFHVDVPNDKIKNFVQNRQKAKESLLNDSKHESNGAETKKLEKESLKSIMNDVFNSLNPKRGTRQCNPTHTDGESDSESSGLEELHLVHGEDSKSSHNWKSQEDRCLPSSNNRTDSMMSLATASRKTYVKRVSSKLLSHSPYTKSASNESLFESCILVGLTLSESKTTVPYVKSIFPSNVKPPPLIESLCFPDASTWSQSSYNLQQGEQYYSLVITNENGDRKFGYCRRVLPEGGNFCLPLVYCIISQHRANGFYYKVLQELESRHGSSELHAFIKQLYECSFPGPGQSLKFKKILEEVTRVSPVKTDDSLPSTLVRRPCDVRLEERDLSQLLQHLKVSVFLKIFSSLLLERKVLLLGHSLRNLSCCIEALQSLLIPFSWQHTYIPVLPSNLNEMCDAPTPYIIGVQKSTVSGEFIASLHFEEGIMVDLEESQIIKCCGDEGSILPPRLVKGLKTALNLAMSASLESDNDRNVLISEAFIRFFVEICGNYSSFIVRSDGRKIFQKEEFVNSVPGIHSFLDWFVETAMFRSFMHERLQNDIEDLFKRRALEHMDDTDKNSALKNYKVINRKGKSLGDRLKDLTLFPKY